MSRPEGEVFEVTQGGGLGGEIATHVRNVNLEAAQEVCGSSRSVSSWGIAWPLL
jgi:hypothetical protein